MKKVKLGAARVPDCILIADIGSFISAFLGGMILAFRRIFS